jgi:uncharacterized protein YkwD
MRGAPLFVAALLLSVTGVWSLFRAPSLFAAADTSAAYIEQSELQMWQLINNDRLATLHADEIKGTIRPLQWDSKLAAVARQHSNEMAANGFFSHQGLDGSLPDVRVSRAGLVWHASAENIAKYPDVAQAEAAFMAEPKFQHNHRANILNPQYTSVGVGIVKGPDSMFYITQDFADLR